MVPKEYTFVYGLKEKVYGWSALGWFT